MSVPTQALTPQVPTTDGAQANGLLIDVTLVLLLTHATSGSKRGRSLKFGDALRAVYENLTAQTSESMRFCHSHSHFSTSHTLFTLVIIIFLLFTVIILIIVHISINFIYSKVSHLTVRFYVDPISITTADPCILL